MLLSVEILKIRPPGVKLNPGGHPCNPMTKRLLRLFLLLILGIATVHAQSTDDYPRRPAPILPPVVLSGLDGYKAKGAEEAVRLWVRDSPLEGSNDATSQVTVLRQAEQFYGAYQWYEVVRTREVSPRTMVVYLVLNYERGPLFSRFTVYRSNHRWIMTYFDFNTREENIFPPVYALPDSRY
jgi:hypothetical protein